MIITYSSLLTRESRLRKMGKFCLWNLEFRNFGLQNLESWALKHRIQLKESGIALTIGIRNPRFKIHNPVLSWIPWRYTLNVRSRGRKLVLVSREFWCSRDEVEGNIRTRGKTKPTVFSRDLTLRVCYISRLSLQQQQKNNRSESKQSTRYL